MVSLSSKFRIKKCSSLKNEKIFHMIDQINGKVVNQVFHSLGHVIFLIKSIINLIQISP